MKVVQDNFENLAASLMELQAAYEAIPSSDRAGRMAIRRIVIEAKTKARWASRRAKSEAKRAQKQEMVDWMLTWLENPPVFETWVKLRMSARKTTSAPSP